MTLKEQLLWLQKSDCLEVSEKKAPLDLSPQKKKITSQFRASIASLRSFLIQHCEWQLFTTWAWITHWLQVRSTHTATVKMHKLMIAAVQQPICHSGYNILYMYSSLRAWSGICILQESKAPSSSEICSFLFHHLPRCKQCALRKIQTVLHISMQKALSVLWECSGWNHPSTNSPLLSNKAFLVWV